jgi:hypothetical protein
MAVASAFDAAVAQREVDEPSWDAALAHALGGVMAELHGFSPVSAYRVQIRTGGGRKT